MVVLVNLFELKGASISFGAGLNWLGLQFRGWLGVGVDYFLVVLYGEFGGLTCRNKTLHWDYTNSKKK